jgi:allantoin racemase
MRSLILINPNTSQATTTMMVGIAEQEAGPDASIAGMTVTSGAPLITDEMALAHAAEAVAALLSALRERRPDGVIVSAFGDPGLEHLRQSIDCPVTGIAEAAMAEAAEDEAGQPRRFAVVTTTPQLADSIAARAERYGHGRLFTGVRLTPGDPASLMANQQAVTEALALACKAAIEVDGAQALVIGGGPLALAARALRPRFAAAIIEPIPAAVRLALRRV